MMKEQWMRPNTHQPFPLTEEFYMDLLRRNKASIEPVTERIVEQLINQNRPFIEDQLHKAVSSGVNVTEKQYNNLVDLDFDKEALLKDEDEKRLRRRERTIATRR